MANAIQVSSAHSALPSPKKYDPILMLNLMREQSNVVSSLGIVGSQSVRALGAPERSDDAHTEINRQKRHITVDTMDDHGQRA